MHLSVRRAAGRRGDVVLAALLVILVAGCTTTSAVPPSPPASTLTAAPSSGAPPPVAPSAATPSCLIPDVPSAPVAAESSLVPVTGAWFGMGLDWGADSISAVRDRVGPDHVPAAWVQFAEIPLRDGDLANLDEFVEQVRSVGGIGLITLEPQDGLPAVDDAAAVAVADRLAGYQACGVPIILRFAHEMNGSWYRWGQDPAAYIAAFRRVAAAVHERAPGVAMLWAPNSGSGYPFEGSPYRAPAGSPAEKALDTDGDGALTATDDPYAPYWPGDDAVDWVGMSAYHFGNTYPWGANVVPRPGAFAALLAGTGDATPDFHATWAVGHGKPMAIVETAALWRPSGGGKSELAIKSGWWRQVYSAETQRRFPAIRLIGWFEWQKDEPEVNDVVDWRLTAKPEVLDAFLDDLPPDWLRFAPVSLATGG